MKLEIDLKKNTEKYAKTWKLNNMLLNKEWVNIQDQVRNQKIP